jgi:hypothetical protein
MTNIVEILKSCPTGLPLYSTLHGKVYLKGINKQSAFPIVVLTDEDGTPHIFDKEGKYTIYKNSECILFPSKNNRDWSTFRKPQQFKPFDKVIVRNDGEIWGAELFSWYNPSSNYPYSCIGSNYNECLSYNEETAKLIGTTDEYDRIS